MKELRVGRIPSLTWNRLGVNEGKVTGSLSVNTEFSFGEMELPAGCTCQMLTCAEAEEYLLLHAPAEEPEKVVAGKMPIWHPQPFATGLGPDVDRWFAGEEAKILLIETEENLGTLPVFLVDLTFSQYNQILIGQILHIRRGTKAEAVIRTSSEKRCEGMLGISTKAIVDDGAELGLTKIQTLGRGFTCVDDTGISVGNGGRLSLTQLCLGGGANYLGVQTELTGDGAEYDAKLGYYAGPTSKTEISYNTVQRGKKTKARLTYDGVLCQDARKSLRGTIDFRRGSEGSTGDEQENVLLLSDQLENKSLPVILCEEEDVEGRHGASIGQLDDAVLFYLASRGIPEREAVRMMVRARLGAVADRIPDPDLRTEVRTYIDGSAGV